MARDHVEAARDHQQAIGQRLAQRDGEHDGREVRSREPSETMRRASVAAKAAAAPSPIGHDKASSTPSPVAADLPPVKPSQIERPCPSSAARPARQTAHGTHVCRSSEAGGVAMEAASGDVASRG